MKLAPLASSFGVVVLEFAERGGQLHHENNKLPTIKWIYLHVYGPQLHDCTTQKPPAGWFNVLVSISPNEP